MSGRKSNLIKYQTVTSGSMGADVTSAVTNIEFQDNIGVQLNFTGTPVGTFAVQVSIDYGQDAYGNVTSTGNWIPISLSTTPTAAGAADQIYISLNQLDAPWIRVKYTRTSGTGTLNAYICGKQV